MFVLCCWKAAGKFRGAPRPGAGRTGGGVDNEGRPGKARGGIGMGRGVDVTVCNATPWTLPYPTPEAAILSYQFDVAGVL